MVKLLQTLLRSDNSIGYICCCMERLLVRWLPFAASNCIELQQTKAANGIQLLYKYIRKRALNYKSNA